MTSPYSVLLRLHCGRCVLVYEPPHNPNRARSVGLEFDFDAACVRHVTSRPVDDGGSAKATRTLVRDTSEAVNRLVWDVDVTAGTVTPTRDAHLITLTLRKDGRS